MGQIKTAMELALERTEGLKADRTGVQAQDAKREGRVLGARRMEDGESVDLKKELSKFAKPLDRAAREGAAEAILSRLQLPRDKESLPPLEAMGGALGSMAPGIGADKRIAATFKELSGFLGRYLEDMGRLEEGLTRQYAPKLKQKEQELKRRTGQDVRIDPRRDPEFLALLSKNVTQLKGQYQDALDQAKEDLKDLVIG
jgi:hypothetical protein